MIVNCILQKLVGSDTVDMEVLIYTLTNIGGSQYESVNIHFNIFAMEIIGSVNVRSVNIHFNIYSTETILKCKYTL